jgi:predicted proteasome-type protease
MSDEAQRKFAQDVATEVYEYPSRANPERMCVLVQAGSFAACQNIVSDIQDRVGHAVFTIPSIAENGSFVCFGHYMKAVDELPEFP